DRVFVNGNKDVATKQFKEMLKMAGFSEGKTYSAAKLASVKNNLLKAYEERGKYTAKIDVNVIELPRNRVNIELNVSEGKTAELAEISFTGNENYGASKLKKQMQIKESGLMTLLTKSDRYDSRRVNEDMESIEKFYQERGYINAEVNTNIASVTPDQEKMFVDINVHEGNRYRIEDFEVIGNTHVPFEELTALVELDKGKYYKKSKVDAAVKAIQDRLGDDGYALARVNAIPQVDEETKTVKILFSVDNGEKIYVRRVNIEGNERTQDGVFRREIRQMEGSQFISSDVDRSKIRLQRLPYVEEVEVVTSQVDSDLVDLTYKLKERSAGSITFGLSYGMESKFGFNISFDQPNFMGTGNQLTVSAETDDESQTFSISYTNPYFTDSGISAGVSAHYSKQKNKNGYTADYLMDGYGLSFNFGYPLTEFTSIGASVGYDRVNLKTTRDSPVEIVEALGGSCTLSSQYFGYCNSYDSWSYNWTGAKKTKNLFRFSTGISRDTRDKTVFATEGSLNSLNISGTLPGSTDQFYIVSAKHSSFYPLLDGDDFVLNLRGDLAKGYGYGKTSGLPFYERFYAGGLRTVRGYRSGTLGPRYLNDQSAGGDLQVNATAELIMRVPGFAESNSLRWSIFFDAGQVYGLGHNVKKTDINVGYDKFKTNNLRYSAGVSMAWFSPIGPLVFSYANPIKSKSYDRKQKFQFSVGIPF
ncbi:outer membrane protein assembly factor BamA, partial [Wohlfahrtiimonas larvae]